MAIKAMPNGDVWVYDEEDMGKDPTVEFLSAYEGSELFRVHFIKKDSIIEASYGGILYILEHGYMHFKWESDPPGKGYEPLLIDAFTASAIKAVHDALKPETQRKMEEHIAKSRGHFMRTVELVWESTK